MKYEWRKKEKKYYFPKQKPEIINIEKAKFITIKGKGNPNEEQFSKSVEALYTVAYSIKMMPKRNITPHGYFDYTVYPLEGTWDLSKEGLKEKEKNNKLNKDCFIYNIMIKQPSFVTKEVFELGVNIAKEKKKNDLIDNIVFEEIDQGMCVQMMHIGPFDDEYKTFDIMKKFCKDNNLSIKSLVHREIYLSDSRKTAKEKMKTVLRYRVEENNINK